jgi:hypothetical protein
VISAHTHLHTCPNRLALGLSPGLGVCGMGCLEPPPEPPRAAVMAPRNYLAPPAPRATGERRWGGFLPVPSRAEDRKLVHHLIHIQSPKSKAAAEAAAAAAAAVAVAVAVERKEARRRSAVTQPLKPQVQVQENAERKRNAEARRRPPPEYRPAYCLAPSA